MSVRLAKFDQLPDEALMTLPETALLTGWSRSTLHRRVAAGAIPKPMQRFGRPTWSAGQVRAILRGNKP